MSPNKCPNCGLVNFRSEPQCLRCAAPLPVGGGQTPFFGCTFCGSQLSVTDQHCPACNTPVRAAAEPPRPVAAPPVAERAPRTQEPLVAERKPRAPQRSLAPCPDCGHMVSTAAPACPSCGRPFTQAAPASPFQHLPQPVPYAPQPVQYIAPVQYAQQVIVAPAYQPALMTPPKSRGIYIVLALFLGGLGVHNFYAGYNGRGAAQLVITLVTGLSGGFFLVAIWAFVECFIINTDAYGRRMT